MELDCVSRFSTSFPFFSPQAVPLLPHAGQQQGSREDRAEGVVLLPPLLFLRGKRRREDPQRLRVSREYLRYPTLLRELHRRDFRVLFYHDLYTISGENRGLCGAVDICIYIFPDHTRG